MNQLCLFGEEEWNAMVSTSQQIIDASTSDRLGILHHGLCQNLSFTGRFEMPVVKATVCDIPDEIVAYYRTTTGRFEGYCTHFYTTDDHIELAWRHPYQLLEKILQDNNTIIGTDFSVYNELLFPQKIWNIFRNKLLVAWWQYCGKTVIPNISWIFGDYDCSFDGWPQNSVIAVNSTGLGQSDRCKIMWIEGYNEMLNRLHPLHILRYGPKQNGENEAISTYYNNDNLKFYDYGR